MGKVVKGVLAVGLIAAGVLLSATGAGGVILAGFLKVSTGAMIAIGASLALSVASEVFLSPKIPSSQLSRLNVSLDTRTPRKAVFGTTAMNLDLRYQEPSGTDQEYIDYIIAVAAHKVASIDEIWFEDRKAWDASTGVTSTYSGYLTVNTRTEGTDANTIYISGNWGSAQRLTGCAYVHLRVKRTGNSNSSESPLASGLPSRVTIIGEGALMYDARLDSTVAGGSGSHRANDQTTWGTYTDPDDVDNPALQLAWWLLGWRINGQLSIGCGVPPERIDWPSFIAAANACDVDVALAAGGTQKRYRTSGTASDSDDPMDIINALLTCMNGTLRDSGGKLSLMVQTNDLSDYVLDFEDGDVLGEFKWEQTRGLSSSYNVVRGQYVDPSYNSLYQTIDYPEVSIESPDGIERSLQLDLPYVEDGNRAQRIAKQILQRTQYRGTYSATFKAKAMGCEVGEVVRLTFSPLGWTNKLFRITSKEIRLDGTVPLTMVEENAAIYAWDAEEQALVTPPAPTVYNPLNNPLILADLALANGQITFGGVQPYQIQADTGGVTTTVLPLTRQMKLLKGDEDVTTSAAWSVDTLSAGLTASIGSGTGLLSLSAANSVGAIVVKATYEAREYFYTVPVNRSIAIIAGGESGSTTYTDTSWTTISTASYVAVTDAGKIVQSNGSGELQYSAYGAYDGDGIAVIKAQYSPDNMTWTDFAAEQTGSIAKTSPPGEEDSGFVSIAQATKTGLTASTDYYVRLLAKRSTGTGNLSFHSATFNVRQP